MLMLEREREMWNESERLGEKKERECVRAWRERGKKGERERETYERIQRRDVE
jgi:hypothetical protein